MGRPKINNGNCINGCEKPAVTKQMCYACYKADYYQRNRNKENQSRASYNKKNANKIAARKRVREQVDLSYKIANRIRHRLYVAVKNKTIGTFDLLGCSTIQLMDHLESRFQVGMSWDNYGEWHIDHIKPLAAFNLTDMAELSKAAHYTNLQPLWASDNIKKRDTYEPS